MNIDIQNRLKEIEKKLLHMWRYLDLAGKEEEIKKLESQMEEPHFWDNAEEGQKVSKKVHLLKSWTDPYKELKERYGHLNELFNLADKTNDDSIIQTLLDELSAIESKLKEMEIKKMLSGELDSKSCFCSINAGAGGTESCDWVAILARMYERWANRKGWKVSVVDKLDGEVAGIKHITFRFDGDFAYGYSKSEKGVHRLVRISPFDSSGRRHTSFASVDISPIIEDEIKIDIRPDDIRVDTYRASGAGGQHVNRTDSAVRITHFASGIVVSCQSERSQIQNKETCMQMLKSKLYEKEILQREEALKKIGGEKKEIAWGSQIRNYVFQPYTLVKDTRTKYETGNLQAVLDGDLDEFVNAYLKELE
ncbi:MAG: peptide chain release factor 2 [Chlamydiae bacterium]|nr:peptide chain release factor 2 [Chlamydiota bacterium]